MRENSSRLSVAVIGGGFGRFHVTNLLAQPRFQLIRFCDQNPKVVKEILEQNALPASVGCADYQQVLRDPEVEAVVISLPHHLHEPVCVAAAQNGKHVLVDKPIARTLEEADRIIEAAEKNQVTLMVAHNQRFETRFGRMKEELEAGSLGRLLFATSSHLQNFNVPGNSYWRSRSSVGGGCVIGSGVHNLDLMRWFFGEAEEVFAYSAFNSDRLEAEVAVSASLRFRNNVVVNFVCNWNLHGNQQGDRWGLYGTDQDLILEVDRLTLGRAYSVTELPIDMKAPLEMWNHFADCIRDRSTPLTSGRDARSSLELVLKIYESIENKRPASIGHQ